MNFSLSLYQYTANFLVLGRKNRQLGKSLLIFIMDVRSDITQVFTSLAILATNISDRCGYSGGIQHENAKWATHSKEGQYFLFASLIVKVENCMSWAVLNFAVLKSNDLF